MKQNWEKYQVPILHACSSSSNNNPLHSLELLDKQFRTGPTAKLSGGFQVYQVKNFVYTYITVHYHLRVQLISILSFLRTHSDPRLVLFLSDTEITKVSEGFVVAEKNVLFEVTDFTVIDGLISLLAAYYVFHVNYPKSVPAQSLLLFLQEYLLENLEPSTKKSAATVNAIKKATDDQESERIEERVVVENL